MSKIIKNNISNIEGLENTTILKTLQSVIEYVKQNAIQGPQGETGKTGETGPAGVSIVSIENKGTSKGEGFTSNHIEATLSNGAVVNFDVYSEDGAIGEPGPQGENGVSVLNFTSAQGTELDGYTITPVTAALSNGLSVVFAVYAKIGEKGATGATGNGISMFEYETPYQEENYTVTPVKILTTDGNSSTFNVKAKNGTGEGYTPEHITISPESAVSGNLSSEQMQILNENSYNYIMLNNEKYILMDSQKDSGLLVYSHVGQDTSSNYFIKCITITIDTKSWVMTYTKIHNKYLHTVVIACDDVSGGSTQSTAIVQLFLDTPTRLNMSNFHTTLQNFLVNNGFKVEGSGATANLWPVSGYVLNPETMVSVTGCIYSENTEDIKFYCQGKALQTLTDVDYSVLNITSIIDTVIAI